MTPEILQSIPISGSFDEERFDAFGDCTWVKFENSDSIEWVGVFGKGVCGGTEVHHITSGEALVLSHGQGYILDVNSRKLLNRTCCGFLQKAISCSDLNAFVAATDTDIYVYDKAGLIFRTNRIASDGINFKSYGNGTVSGEVWGIDSWYAFSLDIKRHEYSCDWLWTL